MKVKQSIDRLGNNQMKLAKNIKNRWSPRAFSNQEVTDEMIDLLFEAARWAPSSRNEQPWQYYYAKRADIINFETFTGFLNSENQLWAKHSQMLIISVVKKNYDYQNKANRVALHDVGAANISISLQAAEMGFQVHQMAGFDKLKVSEFLNLNTENFEPVTMLAVGFTGNADTLPDDMKTRELAVRKRKQLNEFVFQLKDLSE